MREADIRERRAADEQAYHHERMATLVALYAFDGTWNVDEADEIKETNVLAFCKCLPLDMNVFYLEGVGSRLGFIGKLLGGLGGVGGRFRIARAMEQPESVFFGGRSDDRHYWILVEGRPFDPIKDPQRTNPGDFVHESVKARGQSWGRRTTTRRRGRYRSWLG
jgi:hypothetical protein